jgi:hypothetical protein
VVAFMIRAITLVSACLLTTGLTAHAGDSNISLLDLGVKSNESGYQPQSFHRVETNLSPREYKELYNHNQKVVRDTLRSYSNNVLKKIGIPEEGGHLMGAALGLVVNDRLGLDLNKSKTLALELEDVDKADRSLYFRIKLGW